MEQERNQSFEEKAVIELQFKHWQLLQSSPILQKITAHAEFAGDLDAVLTGWPIVLGSESDDVRHIFLAFREPSQSDVYPVRSRYYTVGTCIQSTILPNRLLGIEDADFVFVDGLFQESSRLEEYLRTAL